jgi:hypothetical protein
MLMTRPDGRPASGNVAANFGAWQAHIRDQFEEIQRRERHWYDTFGVAQNELYGESSLRERLQEYGSWMVAKSDIFSAGPLALARYEQALAEGDSIGTAKDKANLAVRTQHGSTAITNQPDIVRQSGVLHPWMTSVYGFFGTVMQRRIETLQKMNDIYQLGKEKEIAAARKQLPSLFWNVMHYWVIPTMIEEWVTSQTTENKEGWGEYLAKASVRGAASSFIYLRDIVYAITTHHDPSFGLASSPVHDFQKTYTDMTKGTQAINREHAGKTVQDFLTAFGGIGAGVVPKEWANIARFGIDVYNKQAHPKDVSDYLRGLTRGTEKERVEK